MLKKKLWKKEKLSITSKPLLLPLFFFFLKFADHTGVVVKFHNTCKTQI